MKFSNANSPGSPSRSARARLPVQQALLTLTKGVSSVSAPPFTTTLPNQDHKPAQEGATVVWRDDVTNTGNLDTLDGTVVWDPLPSGLTCADVSAISNGGTCDGTTNTMVERRPCADGRRRHHRAHVRNDAADQHQPEYDLRLHRRRRLLPDAHNTRAGLSPISPPATSTLRRDRERAGGVGPLPERLCPRHRADQDTIRPPSPRPATAHTGDDRRDDHYTITATVPAGSTVVNATLDDPQDTSRITAANGPDRSVERRTGGDPVNWFYGDPR